MSLLYYIHSLNTINNPNFCKQGRQNNRNASQKNSTSTTQRSSGRLLAKAWPPCVTNWELIWDDTVRPEGEQTARAENHPQGAKVKKRRSQWSQLSPTQDLWLTLDRGQSLQVSAKMWKAFPRSILEDVIARMMCSKCLADLLSATGTVGERWERQRARATKDDRDETNREKSLCALCYLVTHYNHRLWLPLTQIKPWRSHLYGPEGRGEAFHAAYLNWPNALNVNTSQTLSWSLSPCCCWSWQPSQQLTDTRAD